MISKLFTPVVRPNETSVDDAREVPDRFVNVPVHAEVPRFQGNTDTGQPWYPLKLRGKRQSDTSPVEQRVFKTFNGKIDY